MPHRRQPFPISQHSPPISTSHLASSFALTSSWKHRPSIWCVEAFGISLCQPCGIRRWVQHFHNLFSSWIYLFSISIGCAFPGSVPFKYVLLSGLIRFSFLLFVMMCPPLVSHRFTSAAIVGARKQCKFIGGRYQCPRRRLLWFGHLFRTQWCIECHHQRYIDNQIAGGICTENTRHHSTQNDFAQRHHAETSRSGQEFGHDIRTRESARFGISYVELYAEQTTRRQNM